MYLHGVQQKQSLRMLFIPSICGYFPLSASYLCLFPSSLLKRLADNLQIVLCFQRINFEFIAL